MANRTPPPGRGPDAPIGLPGRRIGDRRVRIARVKPADYRIAAPKRIRKPRSPAFVLLVGFSLLILLGTVLLALPISSKAGAWTEPVTALFTATSAVCVTGLVLVDTATYWSPF